MGLSASIQNTNILIGHHYPQGTGATSVFYRIQCNPLSSPCAKLGEAITLTAAGSENTCSGNTGGGLTYLWSDNSTNASITDTPPASGATYSVTVTDPATGCSAVAVRTVVPCDTDN